MITPIPGSGARTSDFRVRHGGSACEGRVAAMTGSRAPVVSLAPFNLTVTDVAPSITQRPLVQGKFFFVGGRKFIARGVTYGPFRPDEIGCAYHNPDVVS